MMIIIIINRTLHNSIQNTDLSVNKKSKKIIGKKGNLIELNPKEKNCKKKLTDMLSLGYETKKKKRIRMSEKGKKYWGER